MSETAKRAPAGGGPLRPCPFCGAELYVKTRKTRARHGQEPWGGIAYYAEPDGHHDLWCLMGSTYPVRAYGDTREAAAERLATAWNGRTPMDPWSNWREGGDDDDR